MAFEYHEYSWIVPRVLVIIRQRVLYSHCKQLGLKVWRAVAWRIRYIVRTTIPFRKIRWKVKSHEYLIWQGLTMGTTRRRTFQRLLTSRAFYQKTSVLKCPWFAEVRHHTYLNHSPSATSVDSSLRDVRLISQRIISCTERWRSTHCLVDVQMKLVGGIKGPCILAGRLHYCWSTCSFSP